MATIGYRELYCPAHFGTSYEVMGDAEAAEVLAEAKWWGFNVYGDWFDAADLKDPLNNPKSEWLLPQAILERKLSSFAAAAREGLALDLATTPNHVWMDQLRPELLADTSGDKRMFGQLLCPSKPEARELILRNHEKLFGLFRQRGLNLSAVSACPYDYGGCSCERCSPWIVTFGRLLLEIGEAARRFFPDVRVRLIGWWWTADEHRVFAEWADRASAGSAQGPSTGSAQAGAAGDFPSLARHIKYGQTAPDFSAPLPRGCESHAFVHIGYADAAEPSDVYGAWGPVVAPRRIEETVANLARAGSGGFMAYSEGVFDDANKAILGGLASGKFAAAREVLECYAERYFGAAGSRRGEWADWLAQWGRPFEVDAKAAAGEFAALARGATPGWRLAGWEHRVRLFEAHQEVAAGREWDAARLSAARRFLDVQERLYRDVWKLGLVRHGLHPRFRRPAWFADYDRRIGEPGRQGQAVREA